MHDIQPFYYEVASNVARVCYETLAVNGGFMELQELLTAVLKYRKQRNSKSVPVSEEDIILSVKQLEKLGKGFRIVEMPPPNRKRYVHGCGRQVSFVITTLDVIIH